MGARHFLCGVGAVHQAVGAHDDCRDGAPDLGVLGAEVLTRVRGPHSRALSKGEQRGGRVVLHEGVEHLQRAAHGNKDGYARILEQRGIGLLGVVGYGVEGLGGIGPGLVRLKHQSVPYGHAPLGQEGLKVRQRRLFRTREVEQGLAVGPAVFEESSQQVYLLLGVVRRGRDDEGHICPLGQAAEQEVCCGDLIVVVAQQVEESGAGGLAVALDGGDGGQLVAYHVEHGAKDGLLRAGGCYAQAARLGVGVVEQLLGLDLAGALVRADDDVALLERIVRIARGEGGVRNVVDIADIYVVGTARKLAHYLVRLRVVHRGVHEFLLCGEHLYLHRLLQRADEVQGLVSELEDAVACKVYVHWIPVREQAHDDVEHDDHYEGDGRHKGIEPAQAGLGIKQLFHPAPPLTSRGASRRP